MSGRIQYPHRDLLPDEPNLRQAVATLSADLFWAILPDGFDVDAIMNAIGPRDFGPLEKVLLFPPKAKITGVCATQPFFGRGEVAVRICHPSFVKTVPGGTLPSVEVLYTRSPEGLPVFLGFWGSAVEPVVTSEDRPVKFREFL